MARADPQISIRIPVDLKGWFEEQAKLNIRSLSGQILYCLEECRRRHEEASGLAAAQDDNQK